MKLFLFFSLSLIIAGVYAQDTIAYNRKFETVDINSPEVNIYKITRAFEGNKFDSIERTYFKNGQVKIERTFNRNSKNNPKVYEGMHKHWYESGKPFYTEYFRNGKRHGSLVAFHENGKLRRRDLFRKGKLMTGEVWDNDGNELEYFPHFKKPEFPGGQSALSQFLRNNIRLPEYIKAGEMHKVIVQFTLDTNGKVASYNILESPEDRFYLLETLRVLDAMPAWEPAESFGKKVKAMYKIPVIFSKS